MLGHSRMVSKDQIKVCLEKGWIVLVPNHRLCPQVNILDGPMQDCRDLLNWVYNGGLDLVLASGADTAIFKGDLEKVVAFGTSSGGHLALTLVGLSSLIAVNMLGYFLMGHIQGYGVERPVAAIFNMYGAVNFSAPCWAAKLPHVAKKLPNNLSPEFLNQVYKEHPVPTAGGVSLEGQAASAGGPDFSDPRQAFALTQIANGTVIQACYPPENRDVIDPIENISSNFPPTFIVHGQEDNMVPINLSRDLFDVLKKNGVQSGMNEVPNEGHTFAAQMKVGSRTWELQREGFDFLESVINGKTGH